ncbi:MAG: hypothetical protein IJD98_00330 [Oscillospiraceae bacterium]|nr:hypothetical protein [Oscillospiraceae bacterium]
MINGVINIVAAVLFAVVFLASDMGIIWLWIAGIYLVIGIGNLLIYAIKNKTKLRAAQKQAEKSAKEAEQASKAARQMEKVQEPVEKSDELAVQE